MHTFKYTQSKSADMKHFFLLQGTKYFTQMLAIFFILDFVLDIFHQNYCSPIVVLPIFCQILLSLFVVAFLLYAPILHHSPLEKRQSATDWFSDSSFPAC